MIDQMDSVSDSGHRHWRNQKAERSLSYFHVISHAGRRGPSARGEARGGVSGGALRGGCFLRHHLRARLPAGAAAPRRRAAHPCGARRRQRSGAGRVAAAGQRHALCDAAGALRCRGSPGSSAARRPRSAARGQGRASRQFLGRNTGSDGGGHRHRAASRCRRASRSHSQAVVASYFLRGGGGALCGSAGKRQCVAEGGTASKRGGASARSGPQQDAPPAGGAAEGPRAWHARRVAAASKQRFLCHGRRARLQTPPTSLMPPLTTRRARALSSERLPPPFLPRVLHGACRLLPTSLFRSLLALF